MCFLWVFVVATQPYYASLPLLPPFPPRPLLHSLSHSLALSMLGPACASFFFFLFSFSFIGVCAPCVRVPSQREKERATRARALSLSPPLSLSRMTPPQSVTPPPQSVTPPPSCRITCWRCVLRQKRCAFCQRASESARARVRER